MRQNSAEQLALLHALAMKLQLAPRVLQLATADRDGTVEEIATEAATTLVDIEQSCAVLSKDLLPKLRSLAPGTPEFDDVLDDIAEEYRHIYYHIVNTKLFKYVVPSQ